MDSHVGTATRRNTGMPYETLPRVSAGQTFGLLKGVRVVDLTSSVAGPYATMLLSDFGAEIIKVERPAGDDARHWGPPFLNDQALWFSALNRNKKSVVIDVTTDAGRADIIRLVRNADVVVTNQPASVQRKLGLDYDTLSAERKDLIFTSITGFGLDGARADLNCYDLIAEGYSGVMDLTGDAGSEPQKIGAPAADMLAGQDAAMGTIAALFERRETGCGHLIDVSLVESMTRFLACRISPYLGSGEVPSRSGGTDSVIAVYQAFQTADLAITLGLGSDAIWGRFWKAVGEPEFGANPAYASNSKRRANRSRIVKKIQDILQRRDRAEWLAIFAEARVPAGPINRVDEVAADQALQGRGFIYAMETDDGNLVPQIGLGIRIDGAATMAATPPPRLGAHTADILGPRTRSE